MTAGELIRKVLLPPGPILSLLLVGLMLLGGMLYNRAVRFQRFLEPTLAITQPRVQFDQDIAKLLVDEIGPVGISDVRYLFGTIRIRESVFFGRGHTVEAPQMLKSLASFFLKVLDDPVLRDDIKVVLVSLKSPVSADPSVNRMSRHETQDRAEGILNTLFNFEPELEKKYATFFETSAMSVGNDGTQAGWIDFRIILNEERIHIEVLQKLEKYAR